MDNNTEKNVALENIVSLAKRRGFIYPGSDVYGGLSGTWDYGPLGVALKRNIMQLWWKMFVDDREDMYGVDAAILMNKKVWESSGHTATFADPMIECGHCKSRFRTDKLIDEGKYHSLLGDAKSALNDLKDKLDTTLEDVDALVEYSRKFPQTETLMDAKEQLQNIKDDASLYDEVVNSIPDAEKYLGNFPAVHLERENIKCSVCGEVQWGESRPFNMMFITHVGPTSAAGMYKMTDITENIRVRVQNLDLDNPSKKELDSTLEIFRDFVGAELDFKKNELTSQVYLRPETAQGIFTNFKNVVDSFYPDLPFGLAQQGKAFRNEISPRDFVFRSREFEQMEIEYFVEPDKWEESFNALLADTHKFLDALGLPQDKVHELEVPDGDRAHYSKRTIDIEYDFPIGKEELMGIAYRTDFDLTNIQNNSGKSMEYTIKGTNTKFVPHVIEPSFGVERAVMAVLSAAYTEDEVNGEKRIVMKFPEHLAPVKYSVSPLLRNKPELVEKAREVYQILKKKHGNVMWDDNGNIGKRYRRQDEIGTPYVVVIDFDTLEDNTVTIRDRDTTSQERVPIDSLK